MDPCGVTSKIQSASVPADAAAEENASGESALNTSLVAGVARVGGTELAGSLVGETLTGPAGWLVAGGLLLWTLAQHRDNAPARSGASGTSPHAMVGEDGSKSETEATPESDESKVTTLKEWAAAKQKQLDQDMQKHAAKFDRKFDDCKARKEAILREFERLSRIESNLRPETEGKIVEQNATGIYELESEVNRYLQQCQDAEWDPGRNVDELSLPPSITRWTTEAGWRSYDRLFDEPDD
jgi:hypothetical protein